jgi:hypothetical protein
MRWTDANNHIGIVIASGTFKIQDVVGGSYTTIFNSVYGGADSYTFVLTGSSLTASNSTVSSGTLSTSNTGTKLTILNGENATMSLSSLSAKSM